jgi:heme oxygenase
MANNLKELTWEHHQNAERTDFADQLLSGDIEPRLYQKYLHAQMLVYSALESNVDLPMSLHGVFRSALIQEDLQELENEYRLLEIKEFLPSVDDYIEHITQLKEAGNNEALIAHVYVRHFGDMHGGQIIKKNVPGSGLMYEFENRSDLISEIRELLDDSMVNEARACFGYAERLFYELMDFWREEQGRGEITSFESPDYEQSDYNDDY